MGQGTLEIERRYRVRVPGALWAELGDGWELRQGYVVAGDPSVRIRVGEPRGPVLTFKAGKGRVRREVEAPVPPEMAEALLEASGERVIRKTRYRVDGWELDRYRGDLEGLVLMEIELERADQRVPTPPHGIHVLGEVTDDKRFVGSVLASMSPSGRRALVRRVVGEEPR